MCETCGRKCDAKKRFSVEMSPRIFIFHFKRFTNEGRKINHMVDYPRTFSISNFMSQSIDQMIDSRE